MTLPPFVIERLTRWHADPAARALCEQEIWQQFGRNLCVIATDLDGFSREMAAAGVVAALARVQRKLALAEPLARRHGGRVVKLEGDSLFLLFEGAEATLAAALALREAARAEGMELAQGIACGPVLDFGDELYGDAVNLASRLGEDLARGGELLVTGDFRAQLAEGLAEAERRRCEADPGFDYFCLR